MDFRRATVPPLDRSVMAQWVRAGDELVSPIVRAVRRYVLGGGHVHADDTPLPVLDPGRARTQTGYLWTYVRDERGWGSQQPPAVWFEYAAGRGGEHPREHLRDFRGVVHCDGYAGMNELFGLFPQRRKSRAGPARMQRSLCWSHARRHPFEMFVALSWPIAAEAVDRIDALYAIEREIRGLDPETRLKERKERAVPLLDELYRWLTSKLAQLPKSSPLARAIRYTIKPQHWPALTYYCTDGRAETGNNAAERSLRDVALGRRSYLFAGSDAGGERAASMNSLIGCCKLVGIDPEAYLRYVFERIADHPVNRIHELLPWDVRLPSPQESAARAAAGAPMSRTPQTDHWPNIDALLDQPGGHISIGRMPPIEGAAIAINDQTLLASLVRREGETFPDLLKRLDTAIGKAVLEGAVTNEINGGRFQLASSSIRKKR